MANFNLNKVIIGGRLTADPELKTTPSGVSVCSFVVAVNRNRKDANGETIADFLNVTAWRGTAEFITRYFRKASGICVVGSIQTRSWTDRQTGQKRFATEIIADEAYFVDALKDSPFGKNHGEIEGDESSPALAGAGSEPVGKAEPGAYMTPGARGELEELGGEEELPF